MRVRISMNRNPREVEVEIEDLEAFKKEVAQVYADERSVWWVSDVKGKEVGIPVDSIGYIEVDRAESDRHVGFA